MAKIDYEPLLEVRRGKLIDSLHLGAVAITTANDYLAYSCGNPDLEVYMGSFANPLKALALLERGAVGIFNLTDRDLAVLCSTHDGSDAHVEVLKIIQQKVGINEQDLKCGIQRPRHIATGKALHARGELPGPNHHPCSGEHTLMLTLCMLLRAPKEDYLNINHPVQQLILKTISEMTGVRVDDIVVGSDDCSAPTYAVSLQKSAMSLARLMDPRGLNPERAEACATITRAMRNDPIMMAGTRCFDTLLMQITNGSLFAKSGSSGAMGMGILPNTTGRVSPALGVTFKILDGSHPAVFSEKSEVDEELVAPMVATEILKQINALNPKELEQLTSFTGRPLYDSRNNEIGSYSPVFKLEKFI